MRMQHFYDFFQNADYVPVVSSSSGPGQSQATKYISCILKPFYGAIKPATLLAHTVFASVNDSSTPSEIKNSAVVDKLSPLLPHPFFHWIHLNSMTVIV